MIKKKTWSFVLCGALITTLGTSVNLTKSYALTDPILQQINIAEGAVAIKESGLVPEHIEAFKKVAFDTQTYILFRPVNPLSTSLIKAGAATKGMNVHGKSSDWGPMAGYIPYDAELSKVHGNLEKVKKGNTDNQYSIQNTEGLIVKKTLEITSERLKELAIANIIINPFTTYPTIKNNWLKIDLPGGKGSNVFEFRLYSDSKITGLPGEKYKLCYRKIGTQDAFRDVEVMGKMIHGQAKELTADYDLFALAPHLSQIGIPKEEMEKIKEIHGKEKFKKIGDLIIKYGLIRTFDVEKGKLTDWQNKMINQLNTVVQEIGYRGGTVVNHGTEQDNTEFPEKDEKIFIITPQGQTLLTKSWKDTQSFIRENIVKEGYLFYFNRSYNKIAGGNQAKIEWEDSLYQHLNN